MKIEPEYCKYCGGELEERMQEGHERNYCPSCERFIYRNPKPVAAVTVLDGNRILLVKRGIEPGKGKWSLPAGFVEHKESPEKGAARELEEETSLKVDPDDLEVHNIGSEERLPGQYLVSCVYFVQRDKVSGTPEGGDDAQEARFWDIDELKRSDEELRDSFTDEIKMALERIDES